MKSILRFACILALMGIAVGFLPPSACGDDGSLVHRTYPLGALTGGRPEPRAPALGLGLRGRTLLPQMEGMAEEEDLPPARAFTADAVVDLIRGLVPGLGETDGEIVDVEGDRLLVVTSAARHEQVVQLLGTFWAEAAVRVEVEIRRVRIPPGALARLHRLLGPIAHTGRVSSADEDALLDAVIQAGGSVEVGVTRARPGRRAVVGRLQRTRYLRDYEVEIAQDSTVGDPQVDTLTTGWALEVRPFVLQGGDVLLEVYAQTADVDLPIRKLHLETVPFGSVELPRVDVLRATAFSRLGRGETRAVLVREDDDHGFEAFFARARVIPRARPRARGGRLDASALLTPRGTRALFRHPADPGIWPRVPRPVADVVPAFGAERLVEVLMARTAPGLWEQEGAWLGLQEGGRLVVVGPDDAVDHVRQSLHAMEASLLQSVRVRLSVGRMDAEGAKLSPTSVTLDAPLGGRVVWQAGIEAAFLSDWGVEVAQEARMGDPQVDTVFAGLELDLVVTPAPQGDTALVGLDVVFSDVEEPFELTRPGNDCTGPIETPRTSSYGAVQDLVARFGTSTSVLLGRGEDGLARFLECLLTR